MSPSGNPHGSKTVLERLSFHRRSHGQSSTGSALVRPGLMIGATAAPSLTESEGSRLSSHKTENEGTKLSDRKISNAESIAETKRGVRDFAKEVIKEIFKHREGKGTTSTLTTNRDGISAGNTNTVYSDSSEDDNMSLTESLEDIGKCTETIEVFTASGTMRKRAMLDTGSTCNLIRKALVYECGLPIEPYDGYKQVQNGDGTLFMPEGQVKIELHFTRSSNTARMWTETFLLVPGDVQYDLLLGLPFIRRGKLLRRNHNAYVLHLPKESPEKKAERENKARQEEEERRHKAAEEAEERRKKREKLRSEPTHTSKEGSKHS